METSVQRPVYRGPVKAVIFDWAGTTIDYGCRGPVAVFMDVFERNGVPVTLHEARAPMGRMKKDHLREMCRMDSVLQKWIEKKGRPPTESDIESMYREVEAGMVSSVAAYSDLIPGTLETVAELKRRDIRIGSSTGYTTPIMEKVKELAGRAGYKPDAVVSSSDVPAGRPHPYMCYENAIRLQVYPLEAMVKVGDTLVDIEEGLHAGMWTIAVTKTSSEIGLSEKEAAALCPETLRGKLDAVRNKFLQAGAHYVVEGIWDCVRIIDGISNRLAQGERP